MAKDPAFLFYSSDFLTGTLTLSMADRGQYITLLAVMHQSGRLTVGEMEAVLHGPVSPQVLKKFQKDSENAYFSPRLETEMKKRSEFSESRRNSLNIDNGDQVHLYLVKDPKENLYKIGSSKYPQLRLKEIQKYRPGAQFLWISTGLHDRSNEKKLHEQFSDRRHKYDWFYLTDEDITTIKSQFLESSRTEDKNRNGNGIGIENRKEGAGRKPAPDAIRDQMHIDWETWGTLIVDDGDHLWHSMRGRRVTRKEMDAFLSVATRKEWVMKSQQEFRVSLRGFDVTTGTSTANKADRAKIETL